MTIAQPQRKNPALAGFFVSEVKSSETVMGEFIKCEFLKNTAVFRHYTSAQLSAVSAPFHRNGYHSIPTA